MDPAMSISQEHNLSAPLPSRRPFGIRVSLRSGDPFANLVGSDWHRLHWYSTAYERDQALADMASRYPTFRIGDDPSLVFERVTGDGSA
jgi:hypothetical protein